MNPVVPVYPRPIRLVLPGSLRSRRSGFALLITIILMAFLVLLLVGFATFTRVETQLAKNNQQLEQARQNALFGLNIALGRLQAAAGPDQRSTAVADIFNKDVESDLPASPTTNNPVPLNKRYWTGVFKQSATPATNASSTPDPAFVEWLVSGPERTVATAHTAPIVMPASTLPALTDTMVPLVGSKTVSRSTDHIAVTLEDIKSTQQPGFAPGSPPVKIGRYGYWVGDEGVKLRINLDPYWPQTPAGGSSADRNREGLYRWASAMAPAADQMNNNPAPTALNTVLGTAYSDNVSRMPRVLDLRQLQFAAPASTQSTQLSAFSKLRFHEISAHSAGVLADSLAGGLRVDLTRVLGDTTTTGLASDANYGDIKSLYPASIITANYTAAVLPTLPLFLNAPTWGLLRSWAQYNVAMGDISLAPRAAHSNVAAHGPVILAAQMNWSLITAGTGAQPVMAPTVVLWNPYPVDMPAADYEFGIGSSGRGQEATYSPVVNVVDGTTKKTLTTGAFQFHIASQSWITTTAVLPSNVAAIPYRFKLSSGVIPAGKAQLYCLKTDINTAYNSASISTYEMDARNETANYIVAGPSSAAIPPGAKSLVINCGIDPNATNMDPAIQVYLAKWGVPAAVNEVSPDVYTCLPITAVKRNAATPAAGDLKAIGAVPTFDFTGITTCQSTSLTMNYPGGNFMRWLVNFNPRAQLMSPRDIGFSLTSIKLSSATPFNSTGNHTGASLLYCTPGGLLTNFGTGLAGTLPKNGNDRVIVWDVPRKDPATGLPLFFSPADLRHASLDRSSRAPAYSIGSGVADARIRRDLAVSLVKSSGYSYPARASSGTNYSQDVAPAPGAPIVDSNYVLNRVFWDKFFFSTLPLAVPATYVSNRPANARLSYLATDAQADLQNHQKAAGKLMLEGAFNINSTSVDAWQALLASRQNLRYDPANRTWDQAPLGGAVFSRFLSPLGSSVSSVTTSSTGVWDGYRQLTTAGETRRLAEQIVREIKARARARGANGGPALSLADFVNRKLDATSAFGLAGILQAALDAIDSSAATAFAQQLPYTTSYIASLVVAPTGQVPLPIWENRRGRLNADTTQAPSNSANAGGPGMITQHDILALIGGHIASRSDTFRIRVYGESINPSTDTIAARTWCEAIVQRLPDYCDPTATTPDQIPAAGSTNERFGRKFKIVDFRWLNKDDI